MHTRGTAGQARRLSKTTKTHLMLAGIVVLAAVIGLIYVGLDWRLAALLGVNLATFGFYGYDKRQAIVQGHRVPEFVLHVLTLLGGTPAAFAAQLTFRHKTRDKPFRVVFFVIIALQVVAIGGYLYLHVLSKT